jgi:hypothetical protein
MYSKWLSGLAFAAGLAAFGAAETASAQYYGNSGYSGGPGGYRRPGGNYAATGIYFGFGATIGTGVSGDLVGEVGPGLGLDGTLGFRFNPAFSLEASLRGSLHFDQQGENFTNLNSLDGAVKLFALSAGRSDAFFRLGAGFYELNAQGINAQLVGLGVSGGLGYDLRVSDSATVGLQGRASFIKFAGGGQDDLVLLDISPNVTWVF